MIEIFFIALVIGFVVGFICWPWLKRHRKPPFFNTVTEDMPPRGPFIRDKRASPDMEIWHLNGISWYDAIVPPKSHTCWTQTRGGYTGSDGVHVFVRRCACGATSMNDWDTTDILWMERNSRRVKQ